MEFTIKVADCAVAVDTLYAGTKEYCAGYLCEDEAEISVAITPEDIAREREKHHKEMLLEGHTVTDVSDARLEQTAVQRKLAEELFSRNTLVFHGSAVAMDGQAYLFTAKSGTGKSTHTKFWRKTFGRRAVMVNDDKPFLKITDNGVLAYGSPWNGKHKLGNNICLPLKAICLLERGGENVIKPISGQEAVKTLFQQSNRPMDARKMAVYMDLIDKLSKQTEFYRMQCNLEPESARVAYETMSK